MYLPTQSMPVDRSLRSITRSPTAWDEARVTAQARVCTPCVQVGGGRWCVNLPIFGRRCLNVPNVGRWKFCCRSKWTPPFVSCGLSRC